MKLICCAIYCRTETAVHLALNKCLNRRQQLRATRDSSERCNMGVLCWKRTGSCPVMACGT